MPFQVEFGSTRVDRQMERLPPEARSRIADRLQRLVQQPRPRGILQIREDVYRLRVGRYRVIYRVLDQQERVVVLKVARRSEQTYRE